MKYILDFDNCIFDTERLKAIMSELGLERGPNLFAEIRASEEHVDFDPKSLVFPDALQFITEHPGDCVIVSTAWSSTISSNDDLESAMLFQKEKIAAAGITELLGEANVKVVGEKKSEALQALKAQYSDQELVFVDDRAEYVAEGRELGIPSIQMKRRETGWFGTTPSLETMGEISDFNKLPAMAELMHESFS